MNARYPHGVGKVGARDHTKSGDPVTNFKRNNRSTPRTRGSTATKTAWPARSTESS
jgi:hypothetical protein